MKHAPSYIQRLRAFVRYITLNVSELEGWQQANMTSTMITLMRLQYRLTNQTQGTHGNHRTSGEHTFKITNLITF